MGVIPAVVMLAAAIGGSIYLADTQRRQQNQQIDAELERQKEAEAALKAQQEAAERLRKNAEQSQQEAGALQLGGMDETELSAANRKARGKAQLLIEADEQDAEQPVALGTQGPDKEESGVQI